LVLKGAALARLAYPDAALRPMLDLDLLVPDARRSDAEAALRALGYRGPARWEVRPATGPAAKAEPDKPLELPGTPMLVELHTRLEWTRAPFAYDLDGAWARAVAVTLEGREARTLHPDDMLLHVCLHLAIHHGFELGLRGLVDAALLVASRTALWNWPAQRAAWGAQGTAGWMGLTLDLARELLGAPVPVSVAAATHGEDAFARARALAEQQVLEAPRHRAPPALIGVLGTRGAAARASRGVARINPWRRDELRGRRRVAGALRGLRRATLDLRTRAPRYLAALRAGDLAPSRLRQGVEWERRRRELEALMAASEAPAAPGADQAPA
jgi:hypothetical protein